MKKDYSLSAQEFKSIYSKVPRLTVELVLTSDSGILLTKRAIEPCKGQWHLPGSTVVFAESLLDAARRTAKRELGIEIIQTKNIGYIEYPSHYLHGLDTPIGIVFECSFDGDIRPNNESLTYGWFKKIPRPIHADQDQFLLSKGLLTI